MKKLFSIFFVALFAIGFVKAQDPVIDGVYEKKNTSEKGIIEYDDIREADVFWTKRIWRTIDVREKMNLIFSYPQMPLIDIIHSAAASGELTVYDMSVLNADQFLDTLAVEKVGMIGNSVDTISRINPITLQQEEIVQVNEFDPQKVIKYKIKEDWFFDEETSTFQVRILGIAPVIESYSSDGNYLGDETMYWVYYPQLRPIISKYEAYNTGNDAIRLSWEDIFEARLFDSYITKESNVYDRVIQEYATGLDALFESDRIKDELFNFEHDLWSY
ncbi:MAG: gliding motility protein GldN [Chitinophagales bacterium]|nr:gliding motility protein GldN [Chitinophagales bacterium]